MDCVSTLLVAASCRDRCPIWQMFKQECRFVPCEQHRGCSSVGSDSGQLPRGSRAIQLLHLPSQLGNAKSTQGKGEKGGRETQLDVLTVMVHIPSCSSHVWDREPTQGRHCYTQFAGEETETRRVWITLLKITQLLSGALDFLRSPTE